MIGAPGSKILSRPSIVEQLQAYIRNYILEHNLRPDDPLPTSSELATDLGVSISSVREALKALETLGVIEVRHGVGIFVRPLNFDPISKILAYSFDFDYTTVAQLLEIRKSLELSVIPQIINSIDEVAFQELEGVLVEWENNIPTGTWGKFDRQFHHTLNGFSNNNILSILLDMFWVAYDNSYLASLTASSEDPVLTLEHHRHILDSVKARDVEATINAIMRSYREIDTRLSAAVDGLLPGTRHNSRP